MKKQNKTESKFINSINFKAGRDFYKRTGCKYLISRSIVEYVNGLEITKPLGVPESAKPILDKYGDEKDWIIWDILMLAKNFRGGNVVEDVFNLYGGGNVVMPNCSIKLNGCELFKVKINGQIIMLVIKGNEITFPAENIEFPNGLNVITPNYNFVNGEIDSIAVDTVKV